MPDKLKREKNDATGIDVSNAPPAPATNESMAVSNDGKTSLCIQLVDDFGKPVTLSDPSVLSVFDFATGRPLEHDISQNGATLLCQFRGECARRVVRFDLTYSKPSSCDETHYAFALTNNVVVLPAVGRPSCSVHLPVTPAQLRSEMARLRVKVYQCEHAAGAHEYHEHHEHKKHLDSIPVVVKALNARIPAQMKQTKHGCTEFLLLSAQWHEITVQHRDVHPCGPIHLFACAGEPAEIAVCCKPLTRTLKLLFQDDCGQPVPHVAFQMYGREFLGNSTGECEIHDPQPGKHALRPVAPAAFTATEILVGTAFSQTELIRTRAGQQMSYRLDFHVEAELQVLEQVSIHVMEPGTGELVHMLTPNQQGHAHCFVKKPITHNAVLMVNGDVFQTQQATPTKTSTHTEELIYAH